MDGQLGLEQTPDEYVANLVDVFRKVRRVLRDDGTLWLNLGDSYARDPQKGVKFEAKSVASYLTNRQAVEGNCGPDIPPGLKPKDLIGIPWRVAFALQAAGWWLRSDIIWCLSGGTYVYAKTQKGVMPMTIKDMARLRPETVQLWNGERWTQLLGISKSPRKGNEVELVLRSGERIACTPTHRFPTDRGLLDAGEIRVGDVLHRTRLAAPETIKDGAHMDLDAAWFAGLYLAEGSRAGDTIQIAGHVSQVERLARVQRIAVDYGGSVTCTIDGNNQSIRVYGKMLNAIIDTLVSGRTAKDKGFAPVVWQYSDGFVRAMMDGYLSGDGHWDNANRRWRLGFTRNYNLERDLRTACARLGWRLVLNLASVTLDGKTYPTFRGEIRTLQSGHHNERSSAEVVEIRKARCREVYDLGVADEPHLFALASGVLTHNSKPNPMPESVTDRPTKSHEYIFLLTKRASYYYDAEAVKEASTDPEGSAKRYEAPFFVGPKHETGGYSANGALHTGGMKDFNGTRNLRSVWTITTKPYSEAHFATFPPDIPERCILAGTSARGACPQCGAPWRRIVEREGNNGRIDHNTPAIAGLDTGIWGGRCGENKVNTVGWAPSCTCGCTEVVPQTVLDPFAGSGTTLAVALSLGRRAVGVELNPAYVELAHKRITRAQPALFGIGA